MPEIMAYPPTRRRTETFSYLPQMTPEKVAKQIAYIIARGWNPAIEHTEPEKSFSNYWNLWKLPFFGTQSVEQVMGELEACHRANPGHHVRLIAYATSPSRRGSRSWSIARAGAEQTSGMTPIRNGRCGERSGA